MPAVVNTFWIRKGYEGLTFFGQILTPTQADADRFNSGKKCEGGAQEWRKYAKMSIEERIRLYEKRKD